MPAFLIRLIRRPFRLEYTEECIAASILHTRFCSEIDAFRRSIRTRSSACVAGRPDLCLHRWPTNFLTYHAPELESVAMTRRKLRSRPAVEIGRTFDEIQI